MESNSLAPKKCSSVITLSSDDEEDSNKIEIAKEKSVKNDVITCLTSDEETEIIQPSKKFKLSEETNEVLVKEQVNSSNETNLICLDSDNESVETTSKEETTCDNITKNEESDDDVKLVDNSETVKNSNDAVLNHNEFALSKDNNIEKVGNPDNNVIDVAPIDSLDKVQNGNIQTDSSKSTKLKEPSSESSSSNILNSFTELSDFIEACKKTADESVQELLASKIESLVKSIKHLSKDFLKSDHFKNYLIQQKQKAEKSSNAAVIIFKDVYQYVKDSLHSESIEVPLEHHKKLRKLECAMKKIKKRIKKLEETEVDFDEDENSAYMMEDRYKRRLTVIYKKYCKLLNQNPYSGRLTHSRLDFVSSQYNEINVAISKKYKNSDFPNFAEFNQFVKNTIIENKLNLTEKAQKAEIELCFKSLGNLLQTRRKKELYDSHCCFVLSENDPAMEDPDLNKRLKSNMKEFLEQTSKVMDNFVRKQELGDEANQSDSCKEDEKSSSDAEFNE